VLSYIVQLVMQISFFEVLVSEVSFFKVVDHFHCRHDRSLLEASSQSQHLDKEEDVLGIVLKLNELQRNQWDYVIHQVSVHIFLNNCVERPDSVSGSLVRTLDVEDKVDKNVDCEQRFKNI
jgi:hypothetical protein